MKRKSIRLSAENKKSLAGFLFILPWLLGVATFFIRPLISSITYSLSDVGLTQNGLSITPVGFENYIALFRSDPDFVRMFTETLGSMLYRVPLIIILGIFIAILLNQNFRGRLFFRVVFFLPVIVASGYMFNIITGDAAHAIMQADTAQQSSLFTTGAMREMLLQFGISETIQDTLLGWASSIFNLLWCSGVQILLFLAGLQSIPGYLREVADMEGITSWQYFWKITFPMLSPIILLNTVYTIVDGFTDASNVLMERIYDLSTGMEFSTAAAMSWTYFLAVLLIVGIVYLIAGRKVFYMNY
ncbi:MAG: sugar ABC transporter permease [Clostridia bacterium]|nr:sugar ABC transporter permease [Clostridia bacterium]